MPEIFFQFTTPVAKKWRIKLSLFLMVLRFPGPHWGWCWLSRDKYLTSCIKILAQSTVISRRFAREPWSRRRTWALVCGFVSFQIVCEWSFSFSLKDLNMIWSKVVHAFGKRRYPLGEGGAGGRHFELSLHYVYRQKDDASRPGWLSFSLHLFLLCFLRPCTDTHPKKISNARSPFISLSLTGALKSISEQQRCGVLWSP